MKTLINFDNIPSVFIFFINFHFPDFCIIRLDYLLFSLNLAVLKLYLILFNQMKIKIKYILKIFIDKIAGKAQDIS